MTTPEGTLEAVDAALAEGRVTDPEMSELQELALALRAESPRPSPELAARMDERVAAGFPRKQRLRLPGLPRLAVLGGAAAAAVAVIVAVSLGTHGSNNSPRRLHRLGRGEVVRRSLHRRGTSGGTERRCRFSGVFGSVRAGGKGTRRDRACRPARLGPAPRGALGLDHAGGAQEQARERGATRSWPSWIATVGTCSIRRSPAAPAAAARSTCACRWARCRPRSATYRASPTCARAART